LRMAYNSIRIRGFSAIAMCLPLVMYAISSPALTVHDLFGTRVIHSCGIKSSIEHEATLHYDHVIVRALNTHLKVVPCQLDIEFSVVTALQVWWKDMQPGSQRSAISLSSYSCGPFYTVNYNKSRVRRF
jgi:hypothetical protein